MNVKMNKTKEILNTVSEQVEDLEKVEHYDDYGQYGYYHYGYGDYEEDGFYEAEISVSSCGEKKRYEENNDVNNNGGCLGQSFFISFQEI